MTKELLAAKTTEVQECEYQWAVAKARVAQCESEKMSINADKEILQVVAAVLKTKACKNGRVPSDVAQSLNSMQMNTLKSI